MRYTAFIAIEFDDQNEDRAETRAKEMAEWASGGLVEAYGDGDPLVSHVHVELTLELESREDCPGPEQFGGPPLDDVIGTTHTGFVVAPVQPVHTHKWETLTRNLLACECGATKERVLFCGDPDEHKSHHFFNGDQKWLCLGLRSGIS